ncbi:response regulator transcription factor [Nocardia acididurans]|nr:response regulator transcription factor [Nocardia acididurans]
MKSFDNNRIRPPATTRPPESGSLRSAPRPPMAWAAAGPPSPHGIHPRPAPPVRPGGEQPGRQRVLLADAEPTRRESMARTLRAAGFVVHTAADGAEALRAVTAYHPTAAILDVELPVLDGAAVVIALRQTGNRIPICTVGPAESAEHAVEMLEAGADDHVLRPVTMPELAVRLKALVRRVENGARSGSLLRVGELEINVPGRRVAYAGVEITLTRTEFDLLVLLARAVGVVVTRERLLEQVWGYDLKTGSSVLDVFICYLRRKLEADGRPRMLHTVRGVGYVLRPF